MLSEQVWSRVGAAPAHLASWQHPHQGATGLGFLSVARILGGHWPRNAMIAPTTDYARKPCCCHSAGGHSVCLPQWNGRGRTRPQAWRRRSERRAGSKAGEAAPGWENGYSIQRLPDARGSQGRNRCRHDVDASRVLHLQTAWLERLLGLQTFRNQGLEASAFPKVLPADHRDRGSLGLASLCPAWHHLRVLTPYAQQAPQRTSGLQAWAASKLPFFFSPEGVGVGTRKTVPSARGSPEAHAPPRSRGAGPLHWPLAADTGGHLGRRPEVAPLCWTPAPTLLRLCLPSPAAAPPASDSQILFPSPASPPVQRSAEGGTRAVPGPLSPSSDQAGPTRFPDPRAWFAVSSPLDPPHLCSFRPPHHPVLTAREGQPPVSPLPSPLKTMGENPGASRDGGQGQAGPPLLPLEPPVSTSPPSGGPVTAAHPEPLCVHSVPCR